MRRSRTQAPAEGRHHSPAHSTLQLMQAVLEDGLRVLVGTAGARDTRSVRLWREEFDWLTRRDTSDPFSFECLCEALGIDPQRLRSRTLAEAHAAMERAYALAPPRGTNPYRCNMR